MFITSRSSDWTPGKAFLNVSETIEKAEEWLKGHSSNDVDGAELFTYMVQTVPQLKYTVVHEVRGDIWDGDSDA